jgi:shikimate kinase
MSTDVTDLDEEITRLRSYTPAELIAMRGEETFREIESGVLQQVLGQNAGIIALGGGTWTVPANRDLLKVYNCLVIWLDVPFETCWKRIKDSEGKRPLAPDFQQALTLYQRRRPIYELAALRVDVLADMTPVDVAERLQALATVEP